MINQEYTIEVIKQRGSEVLSDEIYAMRQCPSCGRDVARGWMYCPSCAESLPSGELPLIRTCTNVSPEPSFFQCSECGRVYIPVQIMNEGPGVEWNACPGCLAEFVSDNIDGDD